VADVVTVSAQRMSRRNANGEEMWVVNTGYRLERCTVDHEGNIIVGGDFDNRAYIAKYDPYGQFIWGYQENNFPNDRRCWGLDTDSLGNIYVALVSSTGAGRRVVKYPPGGGVHIWATGMSGITTVTARSLVVDKSNGDVYAGTGSGRVYRLDTDGGYLWFQTHNNSGTVQRLDVGGVDNHNMSSSFSSGNNRLVRYDMDGNELQSIFSSDNFAGIAIDRDSDFRDYYYSQSVAGGGVTKQRYNTGGSRSTLWNYTPPASGAFLAAYFEGLVYFGHNPTGSAWDGVIALDLDGNVVWEDDGPGLANISDIVAGPSIGPVIYDVESEFTGASVALTWDTNKPVAEFVVERERWVFPGFPPT